MSAARLCALDPIFLPLVTRVGPFNLSPRAADPYEALVTAVAGQQLHTRAAEAIVNRLRGLHPAAAFPTPALLLANEDAALRSCGFSAAKIASIRDIAANTLAGVVPSRVDAEGLDDDALIARLTTLRGVGRWTVEMLLIFTLGRPDVLPVDDFAIREGWRLLTNSEAQPRPRDLAERGLAWSPCRTTAAWYLWRAADAAKSVPRPPASPGGRKVAKPGARKVAKPVKERTG